MSPKRSSARIPELDGWRVLLVFVVAWYHIWQQSWLTPYIGSYSLDWLVRSGYMPVDGTILLSGFLLFLPWAAASLEGRPLPGAKDFYRRRVTRIIPSYYAFLLLDLFLVAIPLKQYASGEQMAVDLMTHFTFSHNFTYRTYIWSPLFGGTWTIAVEMQMYLLFPWIARAAVKKPGAVMLGLAAISGYYRGYCLWRLTDYQLVVNQLASFFDVYALGMAAAIVYVRLNKKREAQPFRWWAAALATVIFLISMWGIVRISRWQATENGQAALQAGQMMRRPMYVLALCGAMLSLPFAARPLRFLFGNRVMSWLAGISMNFYLVHQVIAVQLKVYNIPYSEVANPNTYGLREWQYPYTWLCFGISLAVAVLLTYAVEKPSAWALKKLWRHLDSRKAAKTAKAAPDHEKLVPTETDMTGQVNPEEKG